VDLFYRKNKQKEKEKYMTRDESMPPKKTKKL